MLALAPDASAASAGQSLASPRKWSSLGSSERAIWGLCQGSGKDPYQCRIELGEPAFKCSCPSRKFPCKHGLGLLLVFAKDAAAFKADAEPGWVADWLASRAERAEKKVEKAKAVAEKPADPEARAKRAEERQARVLDGVAGCRVWLEDVVRRGLAAAQVETSASWERAASRMVDAQAPGLAGLIRRVPETIVSGAGWEVRTLDLLGRIHLLLAAAERLDELPPELAADARGALGFTRSRDEVLSGPAVADRWIITGQAVEDEDRLRTRRTWLIGRQTARRALVLDFAAGNQPLEPMPGAGVEMDAEIAFYPSGAPLRGLFKSRAAATPLSAALAAVGDANIDAALRRFAEALAGNPWLGRFPVLIHGVRPVRDGDRWLLADERGDALPLRPAFLSGLNLWLLVSFSGGGHVTVAGEWDGEFLTPLGAFDPSGTTFRDLAPRWWA